MVGKSSGGTCRASVGVSPAPWALNRTGTGAGSLHKFYSLGSTRVFGAWPPGRLLKVLELIGRKNRPDYVGRSKTTTQTMIEYMSRKDVKRSKGLGKEQLRTSQWGKGRKKKTG